nr:unnamed protein product [Digitaria exilis]
MSSSRANKGKVQEVLEQVIMAAAIVKLVARMVSTAAEWLYPEECVDEHLLYHLRMLVIMLQSTVEEAEQVQIHRRRRWLGEWLLELRDAALDGDKVLQSFGQSQRRRLLHARDQQQASAGNYKQDTAVMKRILIWLFRRVDRDASRLRRTVAVLEKVYASNIGDFLTLLQRSTSSPPHAAIEEEDDGHDDGDDSEDGGTIPKSMGSSKLIGSKQAHQEGFAGKSRMGSGLNYAELVLAAPLLGSMIRTGLTMVMHNVRQAIGKLRTTPPVDWLPSLTLTPEEEPDMRRMRLLVIRIRGALETTSDDDMVEVDGSRWLAKWRRELQAVADTADRLLLLAVSAPAPPAETEADTLLRQASIREELRRAAHALETAVAHLDDFVALVSFTVMV